jgi:hypothetical protein
MQEKPTSQKEQKSKKGLIILLLLIIALLLCSIGTISYWLLTRKDSVETQSQKQACSYNDQNYNDGDSFDATDGCNMCLCNDGNVACTETDCDQDITGDKVPTGTFKVSFYNQVPEEHTAYVRICFENIDDLPEQYCSVGLSGITDTLPTGKYYAYVMRYSTNREDDSHDPYTVINLNKCNYSPIYPKPPEEYVEDCKEFIAAYEDPTSNVQPKDKNLKGLGGERVIFEIKENETLDLGIIDSLMH